jgi:hypothetical protein
METNEGYQIIQRPEGVYSEYLTFVKKHNWNKNIERLRKAIPFIKPVAYRGIARKPLVSFPTSDINYIREYNRKHDRNPNIYMPSGITESDLKENTAAKLKMYEILKIKPGNQEYDSSMLDNFEQAQDVYNLLDNDKKKDYEIIRISRNSIPTHYHKLGYDIGTWGNDYSIICDCSIMPVWHPPALEDILELAVKLEKLNLNMLFNQIDEAEKFRGYYKTKDWAETGDFEIIGVEECVLSG